MAVRAPVESHSTALVRYDPERPKGLLGRLRGAMEKWTLQQGGKDSVSDLHFDRRLDAVGGSVTGGPP